MKDEAALTHSASLGSNKSIFLKAWGRGGAWPHMSSFWSPGWTLIIKTALWLWFL